MVIGNIEYIFPILNELKIKGVAFFDVGRGWTSDQKFGTDLRYTAGGGIRWFSPFVRSGSSMVLISTGKPAKAPAELNWCWFSILVVWQPLQVCFEDGCRSQVGS